MYAERDVVLVLLLVPGRAATIRDLGLAQEIWYGKLVSLVESIRRSHAVS